MQKTSSNSGVGTFIRDAVRAERLATLSGRTGSKEERRGTSESFEEALRAIERIQAGVVK